LTRDKEKLEKLLLSPSSFKYIHYDYRPIVKATLNFSPKKRPNLDTLKYGMDLAFQSNVIVYSKKFLFWRKMLIMIIFVFRKNIISFFLFK
jgi:hypothetical protein